MKNNSKQLHSKLNTFQKQTYVPYLANTSNPTNTPTCIPRWNDVETTVSTSFQRGIHVECLLVSCIAIQFHNSSIYWQNNEVTASKSKQSFNNSFMKFRGIHPSDVTGMLYLGIFLECFMNILRMLQVNPTSVFKNQIFSWKSSKYGTIADNCLTTNYNNSYIILLSCDYVIINSTIM